MKNEPLITAGVIADTHIPDRVNHLHPDVIQHFKNRKVDVIFHAGDICSMRILQELETIAPVIAVAGNRDFLIRPKLPKTRTMQIGGVCIALMHGHGSFQKYIFEKIRFFLRGYRFESFIPVVTHVPITTQLVIFGHSHVAVNLIRDGLHFFNPGSASTSLKSDSCSIGFLRIFSDGCYEVEHVLLQGWRIKNRKWISE